MVKVKSWLFTEVRGKVKKAEFRRRKNKVTELSQKRIPFNPRTEAQQTVRKAYGQCVEEWNKLSESEKRQWRIVGTLQGISGYNAFMRECISEKLGKIWYEITIDNSANSNDLTDYQILLEIVNDATFFEDCKNEQKYLEFYDSDKATLLNHFVEEFDTTNKNAKIWIKVPSIPANASKTIYLKINTSRTEALSNPENVFDFYDDFEDGIIDTNKWQNVLSGVSEADGSLQLLHSDDYYGGDIFSIQTFNLPLVLEYKWKPQAGDVNEYIGLKSSTDKTLWVTDNVDYIMWRNYQGTIRTNTVNNGSNTENSVKSADANWHVIKITAKEGSVKFYEDGELQIEHTTNIPDEPLYITADRVDYSSSSTPTLLDWIRIRKFTEPEPTVSYAKMS